jgi:hypothetical protein
MLITDMCFPTFMDGLNGAEMRTILKRHLRGQSKDFGYLRRDGGHFHILLARSRPIPMTIGSVSSGGDK